MRAQQLLHRKDVFSLDGLSQNLQGHHSGLGEERTEDKPPERQDGTPSGLQIESSGRESASGRAEPQGQVYPTIYLAFLRARMRMPHTISHDRANATIAAAGICSHTGMHSVLINATEGPVRK